MRFTIVDLSNKIINEILPSSKIKIFRKSNTQILSKQNKKDDIVPAKSTPTLQIPPSISFGNKPPATKDPTNNEYRENEMKIQMISKSLHEQIFKESTTPKQLDSALINKFHENLRSHQINPDDSTKLPDIPIKLPPLIGQNIEEHFQNIANEQIQPYRNLILELCAIVIPNMPTKWSTELGWTYYCPKTGQSKQVPYPDSCALIFDVEVCMSQGSAPTMACALGKNGWYSWTSKALWLNNENINENTQMRNKKYTQNEFIPLESTEEMTNIDKSNSLFIKKPKIIVGHNVSYDRARIKEQYWLQQTGTRFLDTMSMHICVSGVTSYQRAILRSNKEIDEKDLVWSEQSSLNNLAEVYRLYCSGDMVKNGEKFQSLDKEKRNVFVEGNLEDVRNDFQNLMTYCANDVRATNLIFKKIWPMMEKRFPHPATLAGMLEIGMAYLPVSQDWTRYIQESNLTYEDLNIEAKYLLETRANDACRLLHNNEWQKHLWMWDQDWSIQNFKFKKTKSKTIKSIVGDNKTEDIVKNSDLLELKRLEEKFRKQFNMKDLLPIKRPLLPGYPGWYRKLCEKYNDDGIWTPGPKNIGTGMQVVPKLLSLCWEGYPMHYIRGHGWGFLVLYRALNDESITDCTIPYEKLLEKCPVLSEKNSKATRDESDDAFNELVKTVELNLGKSDYWRNAKKKTDLTGTASSAYSGTGVWCDVELDSCCWFLKLPHKDGVAQRVGNPLAKDFLNKFSENVLTGDSETAERIIKIARMLSYWRNNRDRIQGQLVVWPTNMSPQNDNNIETNEWGAIIPQIVVCGTLTRRAMEPTWMTASNAQRERVGSELRAMVQAPPGYRFVGADVDSQELWIASVLGDANAGSCHGATPFGWMTLNGTKSNGTDMHSVTAKAVSISRDHAKVINYARIYGAGQQFAERLLKQFNPTISSAEAKSKAQKMFTLTKGRKFYHLTENYRINDFGFIDKPYTQYEAQKLASVMGKKLLDIFQPAKWQGGTESAMFNRLEEIASQSEPETPFLQCRLTRSIEPQLDMADRFMQTRVNWVVQSGAVDFLHLMLVCMRWLMGENIRFCLSFHDEVRYLVKDEYKYHAAVSMHLTNLLTRSFCVHRIGLTDLPRSVAFFTSVEIDRVLRKEATAECVTPSNPHGLSGGYGVGVGESIDIEEAIRKVGGGDISQWPWHNKNKTSNS